MYAGSPTMFKLSSTKSAPCSNTNGDVMPMRFLYPGNEASLNPGNYFDAISVMGGNTQNTKMWVVNL